MKKKSKNGFFLMETLIVVAISFIVMTILYRQVSSVFSNHKLNIVYYNTVDGLFNINHVADFLGQKDVIALSNQLIEEENSGNYFIELTNSFSDDPYFLLMKETLEIDRIILSFADPTRLRTYNINEFPVSFRNYIKTLSLKSGEDYVNSYRLIISTRRNRKNGEGFDEFYSSILFYIGERVWKKMPLQWLKFW